MSDPTSTPTPSRAVDESLARAKLARFIAELFSEQDSEGYARLGGEALRFEVASAARTLMLDPELIDRLFRDRPAFDEVLESRNRLLGHTVRSNCPPYELEYGPAEVFQQSQRLADIAGFYRAFGFEVAGPLAERPDHVVAQWEFLFILAAKEAHALQNEQMDRVECCKDAQRSFLKEHAARWMFAFFERVRRADADGFFARVARLAAVVLDEWCRIRNVATGPRWIELRPVSPEDMTIECGAPGAATVELGPTLAAAMEEHTAP